ncbi:MAG: squalene synthase HpnC [Burkholderiaceae bacterium]|nr:squalene synthase HpnC [Burkholderiaceae bacterium]
MGVDHYENFPVASLLLPASLRAPVQAIYRFARTADDIADEGDAADADRLRALAELGVQLDAIEAGRPSDWPDLARAVAQHHLPLDLLRDLLSAFAQDVTVKRYAGHAALLDYCRRSANPIGRLLLALYRQQSAALLAQSDAICSALQLINFWQDIEVDWRKGRVYLPQSELERFGVEEAQIAAQRVDSRWVALVAAQVAHARTMLLSGAPLARALGGRIGWELRLVVQGGLRIAEKIDAVGGDVFRRRPVLGKADWAVVTARAIRM